MLLFLLLLPLWFKESRSCVLTPAWSILEAAVATSRFCCSSQRCRHISKGSCNSSLLFPCHIAVFVLELPHPDRGLFAGAGWKADLSESHTWLLLGALGDPGDPLHLFLSSKQFSQIPVSENSQDGSCSLETIVLFHQKSTWSTRSLPMIPSFLVLEVYHLKFFIKFGPF